MNYETAVKRLANHANTLDDNEFPPDESLVFTLWQATQRGHSLSLTELTNDVLQCLESINQHVNHLFFLQDQFRSEPVPEDLVKVVSMIIAYCQEYALIWEIQRVQSAEACQALRQSGWMISQAWCGVLHGDIESLARYINESNVMLIRGA